MGKVRKPATSATTNNKPALTATLPKLDMNYFKCNVQPILDGKCGMLQQASFYAAQWPSFKKDVTIAEDGDIFAFYLPQIKDDIPIMLIDEAKPLAEGA